MGDPTMILASYDDANDAQLTSRVDDSFPFFCSKEHAASCSQGTSRFLLAFSDDASRVAPVVIREGRGIRQAALEHPPVGRAEGSEAPQRLDEAAEREFLDELAAHLRVAAKCHRIASTRTHTAFYASPTGATACPWRTFYVELQGRTEEELFRGMRGNYRREIKQAEDAGAVIRYGDAELETMHELVEETMRRVGAPPLAFAQLKASWDNARPDQKICATVYVEEEPVAGMFCQYSLFGAHYLRGGSLTNKKLPGAVKMMHWEVMKQLRERGVKRYDFGGAWLRDAGLESFKRRFGAEMDSGYMWKMDLDPLRCGLLDRFVSLRGRLRGKKPGPDKIEQEIAMIARESAADATP